MPETRVDCQAAVALPADTVKVTVRAELGATIGGRRIVDDGVRERMAEVLSEVRAGRFAAQLRTEKESGYPLLEAARAEARRAPIEQIRRSLAGRED